jgi:PAS domain S-box-containing protein
MNDTNECRKIFAEALNKSLGIIVSEFGSDIGTVLTRGLRPIADAAGMDQIVVYRLLEMGHEKHFGQIYRWAGEEGGTTTIIEELKVVPEHPAVAKWIDVCGGGGCVNIHTGNSSAAEAAFLTRYGAKSLLLSPILTKGELWGAVAFQDHANERYFDDLTVEFLSSSAHICANAFIIDETAQALKRGNALANALNKMSEILLTQGGKAFEDIMTMGGYLLADLAEVDRFEILRNSVEDDVLYMSQIYRWERAAGGTTKVNKKFVHIAYSHVAPVWEQMFKEGKSLNGPIRLMPENEAAVLKSIGTLSALLAPLQINGVPWGFVLFEDHKKERVFDDDLAKTMQSAAFLFANAAIRAELEGQIASERDFTQKVIDTSPVGLNIWDDNFNLIGSNDAVETIFGCTKQYYADHFYEFSPEYQSDGVKSDAKGKEFQARALNGETIVSEWLHCTAAGEPVPCEITMMCVDYNNKPVLLVYLYDLRNLKKMEEAALKAEQTQALIDATPLSCILLDKEANILTCNKSAVEFFKLSKKDDIQRLFVDLMPEYQPDGSNSKEVAAEALRKAYDDGHAFIADWMHRSLDGELLPSEVTLVRVEYGGGYVIAVYIRDMRAVKEAARLVTEKTSLLTAIFNSSPDMIFCKDNNLYYTECNKAMENYFDIRNSDIVGKVEASALNIPPQVAEHLIALDKKVIAEGRTITSEEMVKAFDGRMLPFEMVRSPLIQEGEITGLVGMARDITQRKAAEEEMSRQHSLMNVVNMAAAVLLEPDASGGFNSIQRSMEMVCESMDADCMYLWQNSHKDDGKLYYRQICKWARPGYSMGEELVEFAYEDTLSSWKTLFYEGKSINGPLDIVAEDKKDFFPPYNLQSILAVPLFLKDELWGFISFDDCHNRHFFPITDEHILRSWGLLLVGATQRGKIMRDLENALEEAKMASSKAMKAYAETESALEAKSRFIANMNHEMRTPMNVIVGLTDLMLEEQEVPGKAKDTLQKINIAGNTLMRLISDVLDISKVEAGKMDLMPVQYHVASMLNDIIALNTIRAEDKPVVFKLDINENLPESLFGDDLRVKQILNNLLSNAFKYTKEGTVTLGIDCKWDDHCHDSYVWVSMYVSDTGIGIRKEDIKRLFTDYNQVDTRANRSIKGTGLGLSITKKFVELMEGEISVESEYGKGTTFRVRIRQGYIAGKSIGKETVESLCGFRYSDEKKQTQKKLVRSDLSYARVLVVDDFPTNLDVAEGMLRKYKMQVDCVMSGQESIDLIAAGEPAYDAVFMDHMMPGMDGVEAAKAIRALGTQYAQNIPIIALTANAVTESEKMFLENGFNAFLPKPFNVMSLDSIVQRWVRDKGRE